MEVPGRRNDTSAEIDFRYCEACRDDGETVQAAGFCNQCSEYICQECIKFHRRNKSSKNHDIVDGSNAASTPKGHTDLIELQTCLIHVEPAEYVKFFCPTHDQVGCGDCMIEHHSDCAVEYIPDISKDLSVEKELLDIRKELESVDAQVKICRKDMAETLTSNSSKRQLVREAVIQFRAEIKAHFDKGEAEILDKLNEFDEHDGKLMAEMEIKLSCSKTAMSDLMAKLENSGSGVNKLFTVKKQIRSTLNEMTSTMTTITTLSQTRHRDYKFSKDNTLVQIQADQVRLGCLQQISSLDQAHFVRATDINSAFPENKTGYCLTGMTFVSTNTLLVADNTAKAVLVINVDTDMLQERLDLSSGPRDITKLSNTEIATTMPDVQKVQVMLFENNRLSRQRSFAVKGQCRGIDFSRSSHQLVVTFSRPLKVEIMDIHGRVSKCVEQSIFSCSYYAAFSIECKHIIVSNSLSNSIVILSTDGQILDTFKNQDLHYPMGILGCRNGDILICGYDTFKIQLLSRDGTSIRDLLTRHDGIFSPRAVCLSEDKTKLYVSCGSESCLRVFNITYND